MFRARDCCGADGLLPDKVVDWEGGGTDRGVGGGGAGVAAAGPEKSGDAAAPQAVKAKATKRLPAGMPPCAAEPSAGRPAPHLETGLYEISCLSPRYLAFEIS